MENKVVIQAELLTSVKNLDSSVGQIKKALSEVKLDESKLGLKKLLTDFEKESKNFKRLEVGQELDLSQVKDLLKSGENIQKIYRAIAAEYGDLAKMDINMAKKLFPDEFNTNAKKALDLISGFSNSSKGIGELESELKNAKIELKSYEEQVQNTKQKIEDFSQKSRGGYTFLQLDKARDELKNLTNQVTDAQKNFRDFFKLGENDSLENALEDEQETLKQLQENLRKKSSKYKLLDPDELAQAEIRLKSLKTLFENWNDPNKREFEGTGLSSSSNKQQVQDAIKQTQAQIDNSAEAKRISDDINTRKPIIEALEQEITRRKELAQAILTLEEIQKSANTEGSKLIKQEAELEKQKLEVQKINDALSQLKSSSNITDTFEALNKLGANPEGLSANASNLEKIKESLQNSDSEIVERLKAHFASLGLTTEQAEQKIEKLKDSLNDPQGQAQVITQAQQEMQRLTSQIQQFFSIGAQINLLKRAVNSAISTIKELDATMTEAAVVTDFSVEDMWGKLPEYSAEASKLGATINDLYGATTLYYQQGLKTNEAMALGVETMKMARIAGMESAEATQAMTAALRGFNMELNETSAEKVNDVYSKLAAITAADTEQIATAMSKTASIAASANMEFETTAAFLAQIIETTQEAPETAGTAVKTIIARFTEVKQLFSKGQLTGEDTEGEEININKIDAALKTVGISLKDFLNGSKGLDEIFLELASKWDSLDLATQRYIATTAAGSRQQSRFIAMMQDYGRTTELVGAANNSAGASQEQFNKTMDSLESKLNQLHNAWNNFLMGLTNNEVVKGVVNVLTWLLETLNKIIEGMSFGSGAVKMFVSALTSIMAIKGAKGILKGFGLQIPGILDILKDKNLLKGAEGTWRAKGMELGNNFINGFKNTYSMKNPFLDFFKKADYTFYYDSSLGQKDVYNLIESSKQELNLVKTPEQFNELSKKYSQLGIDIKLSKEKQEEYNKLLESSKGSFDKVAAGAGIAGAALLGLSKIMEKTGASEKAVETVRALGMAFMALPVVTNIAKAAVKTFAKESSAAILSTPIIGWIAGIITALMALGGVLAAAIDTPAEKLEKLSTAAEKASERVEGLKSELSDFNSKMEELKTSETELDGLIVGTQAWKEALEDVNNQILEIIQTMPELAKYVKIGEDGQLMFDPEGIEEYKESIEYSVNQAQRQSYMADYAVQRQNYLMEGLDIFDSIQKLISQFVIDGGDITDLNGLGIPLSFSAENFSDEKAFQDTIEEIQAVDLGSNDDVQGFVNNLISTLSEIYGSFSMLEDGMDSLISAMLFTSDELINYEYSSQLISNFSAEDYEKYAYNLKTNTGLSGEEIIDFFKDDFNVSGLDIQDSKADMKKFLIEVGSYSEEDLAGKSKNDLKELIAEIYANENLIETLNNLISSIENLPEEEEAAIVAATTGNWNNLSMSDVRKLGLDPSLTKMLGDYGSDQFKDFVELQGIEVDWENTEKSYEEDITNKVNELLIDVIDEVEGAYSGIRQDLRNQIGFTVHSLFGNLDQIASVQEYQNYANALAQVGSIIGESGRNLPEEFSGVMQEILAFAGDDADEILSALSGFDFSNPEDVKKFGQYLRDLGWPISEANRFQRKLHEIIGEFNAFNPETAKEDIKKALDFADDIADREENALSQEEYEAAVAAGIDPSNFVWNGQEWVYLEGTMADLAAAVRENTAAMAGKTVKTLEGQIAQGEWFANLTDGKDVRGLLSENTDSRAFFSNLGASEVMNSAGEMISWRKLTLAQRDALQQEIIDNYNNLIGNQGQLDQMTTYQYSAAQSGQEMLGMNANGQAQIEARTRALQAAAYQEGLTDEMIEIMADSLRDQGIQIDENSDLWLAHVRDSKKARRELHELSNSLVDNYEALKDVNSEGYSEALLDTVTKAQAVFGDQADTAFVTKHIDLFLALAEGGDAAVSAWEQLQRLSFEAVKLDVDETSLGLINAQFQTAADWIAYLDGLSFDIYGNADLSNLFNSLDLTYQEAVNLAAQIEALGGYEVTLRSTYGEPGQFGSKRDMVAAMVQDGGNFKWETVVSKTGGAETFRPNSAGGGGGGGSDEEWENPYDKLYNIIQKINEEMRARERIERRYQNLLRDHEATQENLLEQTYAEIDNLERQRDLQNQLKEGRQGQLNEWMAENADMQKYGTIVKTEEGERRVQIDWDLINSVTDPEEGEKIENYISKLEEWNQSIEEVNDSIVDIEDQLYEISMRGKEEYIDLENRVKDAIVAARQEEIDMLSAINESINNTNAKLLEGIQESLDKERQERDNAEKEEELSDKQRRLAYLRQDTSGANALEILELEKELQEGQQDYTDTLIDQKISELQAQNDKAAEQREKQIAIMEAQLQYDQDNGILWAEVQELLKEGTSATNNLVQGSRLEQLLKDGEAWQSLSEIQQMDWLNELNNVIAQALLFLSNNYKQLENLNMAGQTISFITGDGKTLKGTVDKDGNVNVNGQSYKNVYKGMDGNYYTSEKEQKKQTTSTTSSKKPEQAVPKIDYPYGKASETKGVLYYRSDTEKSYGNDVKAIQYALNQLGYGNSGTKDLDGDFGPSTRSAVMAFQKAMGIAVDGDVGDETRAAFRLKQYKTGGLADFTGPAWLDGTKSKPELVLNARDTENFLQLRDILGSFISSVSNKKEDSKSRGDSLYDIDINVDSLGSDYDVIQLANCIKELINEDARYRNNNVISLTR